MDAYVDRTIQLRESARERAPGRNYSFEIAAVLCVALIAATAWAVLAANWVHGGGGSIVVAVTAVIEAALLAQARAPRIAAAIAAPFLGLAAIVPTTLAAMPAVPGETVGAIAGHYLQALFTGLSSTQDWDFTVGLCAILFLCGYWLGWMVLREHRGVLAVIPVFSVLATNVVNAQDPDPIALPETIAVVLALGVVAAAYLGSLGDRWAASRITALDGLGWRFGTSAAGVAVVLTIVALVLPPVSTTDISTKLFPKGVGFGSSGKGAGRTIVGGADTIGFNPSVTLGGALVSHPQLAMTYVVNTNAAVYIRVADDTLFDRGTWNPESGENTDAGSTWNAIQYPQGLLPRDLNPADGGIGSNEATVAATLTLQQNATGQLPLAPFTGEPASSNLPGIAYGTTTAAGTSSLLTVDQVVLDQDIVAGTTIQTNAYISTATEAQLRAAGINYPSWTRQFTAMNDDASKGVETIRTLAQQWTVGANDPYDKALAIEQQLRNPALFQYTLNPPQDPNLSVWPVVYFLTTSHKGYCQYFASAMGSMLRSLGIPTRLVSGYGPGTARAQSGRAGERQEEVTTSDAHSWVEAYFPGYGWIPFEPTPPSSLGDYQPFPRGTQAATSSTPPPVPTAKPVPTVKPGNAVGSNPQVTPTAKTPGTVPMTVVISLAVLGGVVVLIAAALLWMLLPRSLAGAWRRVETLGLIAGVDRRKAETHRAFAARLARARPQAGSALGELATVTARAEFSEAGASGPERSQALRTWRRALLQATLRPRRSPG
ncbi:MAG: transglutaminaseTgpA domain-containing protein [Candidatus Dormiibacterota bacterium]